MNKPIYDDHGTSQRWKVELFTDYRFVLAFENNNITGLKMEKHISEVSSWMLTFRDSSSFFELFGRKENGRKEEEMKKKRRRRKKQNEYGTCSH